MVITIKRRKEEAAEDTLEAYVEPEETFDVVYEEPPLPVVKVGMIVRIAALTKVLFGGAVVHFPASKEALVTDVGGTWARLQWGKGAWENIVSQCHSIASLEILSDGRTPPPEKKRRTKATT
jgi:hypothetical protein